MTRLGCILLCLVFAPPTIAKPREWQIAIVLKAVSNGSETEAVAVPLSGGRRCG